MKNLRSFLFFMATAGFVVAFSSFSKGGKEKQFKGYTKDAGGSFFLLHKKGTGTTLVDTGGAVFVKMKFKTAQDSVFVDINQASHSASYPMVVSKPAYKGDFYDFFARLHVGDSASFFMRMDSLKKHYPGEFNFDPKHDTMKYLGFVVSVDSIYSKAKVDVLKAQAQAAQAERQAEMQKQQAAQAEIQKKMVPIQDSARAKEPYLKKNDFALLSDYIKNKWKGDPNPDNDGIFFQIINPGFGDPLPQGSIVSVRYTGKYLDGTIFDANTLFPEQPLLTFRLGADQMIPGFTTCVSKMKIGSKAIFILPPRLAYSDGLTRVFEVEVMNAKTN